MQQAHIDIIERITLAFETRTLAADDPVFAAVSDEIAMEVMITHARGRWVDIPHKALIENPMTLAFATPPAVAFFLPAFMVLSVVMHAQLDGFTASIISALTPAAAEDQTVFQALEDELRLLDPDLLGDDFGAADLAAHPAVTAHFRESAAQMDVVQKAAVRDYLLFIEAHHGADFPVFGPRQALERFWAEGQLRGGLT